MKEDMEKMKKQEELR